MLRAVFRLALHQTEGLIGSILHLLGLELPVPNHSTIGRRARTIKLPDLKVLDVRQWAWGSFDLDQPLTTLDQRSAGWNDPSGLKLRRLGLPA